MKNKIHYIGYEQNITSKSITTQPNFKLLSSKFNAERTFFN